MTSLVLLIPLSIVILVGAGIALFWAIDHGQFEDMESSALLPMLDGEAATPKALVTAVRRSELRALLWLAPAVPP